MDKFSTLKPWKLVLSDSIYQQLYLHLFPGDGDEHGAVIIAGIAQSSQGVRLLARELILAQDGQDYVEGTRGYRKLKAEFIRHQIKKCGKEKLIYLAVHNHAGNDEVGFSSDDLCSHERGYPALLDIVENVPVGALVFAQNAIAGDIWLPGGARVELTEANIVGNKLRKLTPSPSKIALKRNPTYDRQARLFGDKGQEILTNTKVGIIGLGGAGSLLAEYLGRLGVGEIVLVDPQQVEKTNLPRLVGASGIDALAWLDNSTFPDWVRRLAKRFAASKVTLAKRNILRANPKTKVSTFFSNFFDPGVGECFTDCDYLFLAADSQQARLLFNSIVHQYLIPGAQVGVKVQVNPENGDIVQIHCINRLVTPDSGCLLCNQAINPAKLQQEGLSEQERKNQAYVDEPEVISPSVITLNAIATSDAANDFLFYITGLRSHDATQGYHQYDPLKRAFKTVNPRKDSVCIECGKESKSRFARGDQRSLPGKQ